MHFQRSPSQFRKIINAFDSWNKKLVKDPLEVHQRKLFCFGSLTKSRLLRPGKFCFSVPRVSAGHHWKTCKNCNNNRRVIESRSIRRFFISHVSLWGSDPVLGPQNFHGTKINSAVFIPCMNKGLYRSKSLIVHDIVWTCPHVVSCNMQPGYCTQSRGVMRYCFYRFSYGKSLFRC